MIVCCEEASASRAFFMITPFSVQRCSLQYVHCALYHGTVALHLIVLPWVSIGCVAAATVQTAEQLQLQPL